MNPCCRVQDQLNTSEPTAPYIIGRELNLRKLLGRQWESNPQPFEQLRLMMIKTSASTETATTANNTQYIYTFYKAKNQDIQFPLLCTKPRKDKHKFLSFKTSQVRSPGADLLAFRAT